MANPFLAMRFPELARFLLVGTVNTAGGLCVILVAKHFLGASDISANAIGYAVGLALSFVLNRRWTFQFKGDHWRSLTRFLAVFGLCYLVNLSTVLALIRLTPLDASVCQALGIVPYTVLFYLGCQRYVFPTIRA